MVKTIIFSASLFLFSVCFSQDSAVNRLMADIDREAARQQQAAVPVRVFYSQKLINLKTTEVLHRGVLDFNVTHNFGDIAGSNGGIKRFFGLDNAADVKIAFQFGLTDHLNLLVSRSKGSGFISQFYELGLKNQFASQGVRNSPLSLTGYVNMVVCAQESNPTPDLEGSFDGFSDRLSQFFQIMIARKTGRISLQLAPSYLHTNYVLPGDQENIFSLAGGIRIQVTDGFALISDYVHPFRSAEAKAAVKTAQNINLYDLFGISAEFITAGHVFHLNFTNATNILENRYIQRTFTSWGKGEYRWGFTISRNFKLFRNKNK